MFVEGGNTKFLNYLKRKSKIIFFGLVPIFLIMLVFITHSSSGFGINDSFKTKNTLKKRSYSIHEVERHTYTYEIPYFTQIGEKNTPLNRIMGPQGAIQSYTSHNPIFIDANFSATATAENWNGSGSEFDPYIIEGLNITNTGSPVNLIDISNTNEYFQISNCFLTGGFLKGISFNNVTHGFILNNILNYTHAAIFLNNSRYNKITGNTIYKNTGPAIILDYSDNNTLSGNIISNSNFCYCIICYYYRSCIYVNDSNSCIITDNIISNNKLDGITVSGSFNNVISGNNIYNNSESGISISFSSKINITDNNVYNNTKKGIYLYNSSINTLSENVVYNNSYYGISLLFSGNSTISGNAAYNNNPTGICVTYSSNSIISGNSANDNSFVGIFLSSSPNSTLSENVVHNNINNGIEVYTSNNSKITGNSVYNNNLIGIAYCSSPNSTLSNNTISNNGEHGLTISSPGNSTIIGNVVFNNSLNGIWLIYSGANILSNNKIYNNSEYGIYLRGSDDVTLSKNKIYYNMRNGIFLNCSDNTSLSHNLLYNNREYGLFALSSNNITVSWNDFINNNQNLTIVPQPQAYLNSSNGFFEYNYWDDIEYNDLANQLYVIPGYKSQNFFDFHPLASPHNPSMIPYLTRPRIFYPFGNTISNGNFVIQWSAAISSLDEKPTYSVYYSYDNEETWIELESDRIQTNYTLQVDTVENGTDISFMVVASNSGGLSSGDVSDAIHIIYNEPNPSFNIDIFRELSLLVLQNYLFFGFSIGILIILLWNRKRIARILKNIWEKGVIIIVTGASAAYRPVTRRISLEEVQDNNMRRGIIHYLNQKEGSGARFIEIKNRLRVGTGQLLWHLRVLEEFEIVNKIKVNGCKIYHIKEYIVDSVRIKHELALNNSKSKLIVQLLLVNNEMTVNDFFSKVTFSRTTIVNHLKKLEKSGLITKAKRGRKSYFSIIDPEYVKELLLVIIKQSKAPSQLQARNYYSGDWKKYRTVLK